MTEDAAGGRPGPVDPPHPPLPIPDLDSPPAPAATAPGAGVTDEDRTRYGLLLDRAAERGLLSTSEYQIRLGELAEATTTDRMREIVAELPLFTLPVPAKATKGFRRSGAVTTVGVPSPVAPRRGRTTPWVLLAIVVIAVLVSLVVFTIYAEHVVHTRGTGVVMVRAGAARHLSGLRP